MIEKPKVLIVGAGPTGLTMAHELARDGINCRVVDKSAHRATESRAIAIHPRTVETFELMGLAGDFLDAGHRIIGVNIYGEHERIAHVGFGMLATRYPFVLAVPQDDTERILEERVAQRGVRIERNTEMIKVTQSDSGVSARLRTADGIEDVEADWLLGCDGARSIVRDQLHIPFSGSTYPEHFVLADVKVVGDIDHAEAQVWLQPEGALAFFPLPEDRWRLIIVNSPPDWQAQPTLAQCQDLVDERGLGRLRLTEPRWSSVFRIHRREAGRFREGRVFLLGDAAHIHSPVGGQGMNIGIRDAFNLAWKLSLVMRNGNNSRLLDSYEAERRPVDEAVIRQTDRATRLISLHGSISRFVRDHLMSLLTEIPAVAEKIGETISGLSVNYRYSPIVEDHPTGTAGPTAGDRASDAAVWRADGKGSLRLYDLLAENRHHLLLCGNLPEAVLSKLPRYPDSYLAVHRIGPSGTAGAELIDREGQFAARYGSNPAAYLIRPDGYVAFQGGENDAAIHLPRYLNELFSTTG
jgi:2-polyprenyl-6-methoxyphenol hydroxylase-like FAD-dependent oxidoreductase